MTLLKIKFKKCKLILSTEQSFKHQAVLATREKRSYPQLWCIKALDSALKMLTVAIREAPSADQAGELKNEARRLLKITRQLELPGENIDQQLEALNAIRPQSRNQ